MKDVRWVAVLKARGLSPQVALDYVRSGISEGEGLLFVGKTGVDATIQARGIGDVPVRNIPTMVGEDPWETAANTADRVVILWDRGDERKCPAFLPALQGKKPLDIVWPNGRTSTYRNGELVPSAELLDMKVAA